MSLLRVLLAHLAKELREIRLTLIGIPPAVCVFLLLAIVIAPRDSVLDPILPFVGFALAFVLWCLGVVSSLVPGESRRGTIAFLRRLPTGLGVPFAAKIVVMLASGAVLGYVGYLAGETAQSWFAGDRRWAETWLADEFDHLPGIWTLIRLLFVALVGWTFVASCWLARGSVAFLGGLLLLGVFILPYWLLYVTTPGWVPAHDDVFGLLYAFAVAPIVVAWLSFVRGRRLGGGVGGGAVLGIAATLLLFVPAWAYGAHRCEEWKRFDPAAEGCDFRVAAVGKGGRYAFVNAGVPRADRPLFGIQFWHAGDLRERGLPCGSRSFVLNLETGEWSDLGLAGDVFVPIGSLSRWGWWHGLDGMGVGNADLVARLDAVTTASGVTDLWDARADTKLWLRFYDAATGRQIGSGWSHLSEEEVARCRIRIPSPVPLGVKQWNRASPSGLGYRCGFGEVLPIFDPFRDRAYSLAGPNTWPRENAYWPILVRPGRWLVGRRNPHGRHSEYLLLEPDTGVTAPVKGGHLAHYVQILDDGRVLHSDPETGRITLQDPESGAKTDLGIDADGADVWARTPGGAYLVNVWRSSPGRFNPGFIARLDSGDGEIRRFPVETGDSCDARDFLAVLDETTILVLIDDRRIVRAKCGEDEAEVLFPR